MAGHEELIYEIIARDLASRTLREVADAADGTDKSFNKMTKDVEKLDDEFIEARASLGELHKDLDKVGKDGNSALREVAQAGGKASSELEKTTRRAGQLAEQIAALKAHLKGLLTDLDQTGDRSLLKGIRSDQREIRMLERLKKDLESFGDDAGKSLFNGLGESLAKLPSQVKGSMMVGLAGLAVVAAPAVGAIIGAAVTGAVGAGGVVGGVLAAVKDPQVKEAGIALGHELGSAIGIVGQPVVAPLLNALELVHDRMPVVFHELGEAIRPVSTMVMPLTEGLIGLVHDLTPGLTRAMQGAQPVLRVLAEELPEVGDALGDMLGDIADSDGAIMGMRALMNVIEVVLRDTGALIHNLEEAYAWSVRAGAKTTGFLEDWYGWVPFLGDHLKELNDQFEEQEFAVGAAIAAGDGYQKVLDGVGKSAEEAAKDLASYKDALDEAFGKQMSLDEATVGYQRSLIALKKELADGTRTLDVRTEEGQRNRGAILDQIDAIKDLRDANIDSGMTVEKANGQYQDQLEALRRLAIQMGFNKAQVDAFIQAYKEIPQKAEFTWILNLQEHGANAQTWSMFKAQNRDVERRAVGGPVKAGRTYIVGENGPEIVTFDANGYVTNAHDTAAMMSSPSPVAMGAQMPAINVIFPPTGSALIDALMREVSAYVRVQWAGDVQEAFGRSSI